MKKKHSFVLIVINILLEAALAGVFLCVFAFFHHVLPRITEKDLVVEPIAVTRLPVSSPQTGSSANAPDNSAVITESVESVGLSDSQSAEAGHSAPSLPELLPDPSEVLTEWQLKFYDKFSDEIVVTENSYQSPTVSITMEKVTTDEKDPVTYYIADIYIASIENFQTRLASGAFKHYASEEATEAARLSGGLVTINGDYCDNYIGGFVVRNGDVYFAKQTTMDICVLYYDGSIECYGPDEYLVEDILAKEPYQVWYFGPGLIGEDGGLKETYNTGNWVGVANPRSALGYYEPGHYCFVTVDGRQEGYSRGMDIYELAQLFIDLGCTQAYNMDGGASAVMTFNYQVANHPVWNVRDCGDILLICEVPEAADEQEVILE